jgi:hypothetical protein
MLSSTYLKNLFSIFTRARDVSGELHALAGVVSSADIFDDVLYRPIHFSSSEFVPPEVFNQYGEKSLWFMDSRILWTADALREYFSVPIIINTAQFHDRGFRLPDTATGKDLSQHKFGRAIDFDVKGKTADDVRKIIFDNYKTEPAFRFITAVELNVDWVHIDCRNVEKIFTFSK